MATYIGNLESQPYDFSTEVTSEIFFRYSPEDAVPQKCFLGGIYRFFCYTGEASIPIEESKEFFIFNQNQGFCYKFLID